MAEYFSISAYPEPYCSFTSKVETACMENSILELWAHDGKYDNVSGSSTSFDKLEKSKDRKNYGSCKKSQHLSKGKQFGT